MTNEIKERIDAELPPGGTPLRLDTDTVLSSSRSRRTRRRLTGGGAAIAAVAAVTAVVVSVMTLAPTNGGPKPDDAATGSQHELQADDPVLDPDKEYYWDGAFPAKSTKATESYTSAFWKHFTEKFPDPALVIDDSTTTDKVVTDDLEKTGFFYTSNERLYEGNELDPGGQHDADVVRKRTVLKTYYRFQPGTGSNGTSCCGMTLRFHDDKATDTALSMTVLPKGSYTKRTGDAMDPAYSRPTEKSEIDDITGPNGEDVQNVAFSAENHKGEWHTFARAAILYREDGSAVVVKVNAISDGTADVNDRLDFGDLLGIALALPTDPIT